MKCLICGKESSGEICSKCGGVEKMIYQKDWNYVEGKLIKKTENFRIAVSNLRLSGRVIVSDNPKGLNARVDNLSHYLLNVKECSQVTYQGKKTLMLSIESTGENKYSRYCFLAGFDAGDQLANALFEAKRKVPALVDQILSGTSGIVSGYDYGMSSSKSAAPKPAAPKPAEPPKPAAPRPAEPPKSAAPAKTMDPFSTDTIALASVAEDISVFETKIKKLKVLRDNGILSDAEYEEEKKKLVSIF